MGDWLIKKKFQFYKVRLKLEREAVHLSEPPFQFYKVRLKHRRSSPRPAG